jgi:hypothetical protein
MLSRVHHRRLHAAQHGRCPHQIVALLEHQTFNIERLKEAAPL